ncbi:MAG: tRNA lysidine(34) synthetase TilS [Leptolyngbyaceae cyanobacterium]
MKEQSRHAILKHDLETVRQNQKVIVRRLNCGGDDELVTWSLLHAHLHQRLKAQPVQPLSSHPSGVAIATPLLPAQAKVLIAVSGGQDSQCLLRLLTDLQKQWQWQLYAIHCNHGWRADAAANAAFVSQLTADWGVHCMVETATLSSRSEAAARQWRYQTFGRMAQQLGCSHVVTGHTASDRAETLLFNLVRGSGLEGLQALGWQRPLSPEHPAIALTRPLLDITRAQTGNFCQQFDIPVWEDSTNRDRHYRRNRMRLDVLPILSTHFNPQVEATLAQTAELLTAEGAYLTAEADRLYELTVLNDRLQRRSLRSSPLALQRRVIRRWLQPYVLTSLRFDHVEKVIKLLYASNRSQTDPFPGGAIARVDDPWICLMDLPEVATRHPSQ